MNEPQISVDFVNDPAMVLPGINEIFEALDALLRGEMFGARQVVGQALSGLNSLSQREPAVVSGLNAQERQVLDLLRQARTNRDIAVSIAISEETIKRYMTNLMVTLRSPGGAEAPIQPETSSMSRSA
jgi:DNA-binding NarL/FixJ family response regulator